MASDWIKHDGSTNPYPFGEMVAVRLKDHREPDGFVDCQCCAEVLTWQWGNAVPRTGDIIAYKLLEG